jgi:two-component system cell cycle sensor histidine kinase PleC
MNFGFFVLVLFLFLIQPKRDIIHSIHFSEIPAMSPREMSIRTDMTPNPVKKSALYQPYRLMEWANQLAGIGYWYHEIGTEDLYLSETAWQLYGEKQQINQTNWHKMMSYYLYADQRRIAILMQRQDMLNVPLVFRGRIQVKHQERILLHRVVTKPAHGQNPAFKFGVLRDITEAEKAREALVAAKRQAESHDRAKTSFIATMSHELRTPLNAILGFAELMSEEMLGPLGHPRYVDYARDITRSGQHLLDLISDILELSKLTAGHHDFQDEELVLEELFARSRIMVAGNKAGVSPNILERSENPWPILRADRRAVLQMLVNLLSNAVKFTPVDGRIEMGVTIEPDGALVIWISDNGSGIPADQLTKVTLPFERGAAKWDHAHQGTGLGLPMVKLLVEAHGGHLRLFSREGRGTVVSLVFPPERVLIHDMG